MANAGGRIGFGEGHSKNSEVRGFRDKRRKVYHKMLDEYRRMERRLRGQNKDLGVQNKKPLEVEE